MSQDNEAMLTTSTEVTEGSKKIKQAESVIHKKPGRLRGEVSLTLHTAYSQKLFLGFRPDKRSINLLQFGGRMAVIWDAAERDDPYADWYLLKLYDAILKLRQQLTHDIEKYQHKLNEESSIANLSFTPFVSQQPAVESLWFRTQYGYMGASLIADFDQLMRTVLTVNRVGILLDKPESVIRQEWVDKILALFRLPFNWKSFAITRSDVKSEHEQAQLAQEKMGKLPEPILLLQLRSPFSPSIKPVFVEQPQPEKKKEKRQKKKEEVKKTSPNNGENESMK